MAHRAVWRWGMHPTLEWGHGFQTHRPCGLVAGLSGPVALPIPVVFRTAIFGARGGSHAGRAPGVPGPGGQWSGQ